MAKRRANGEGSIRKRKDGRWEGRYTAGRDPETGRPVYKNVLGKTQAEVKKKLKQAIEENAQLDFSRAGEYTIGQWMDVWFENCAKVKVRPSSHQTYRGYIDHHIKPYIGDIPLGKLTTLDLQQLYKKLLNGGRVERIEAEKQPKGLSPKTVRNINQVISSALTFAKEQKLIISNPTGGPISPDSVIQMLHRVLKRAGPPKVRFHDLRHTFATLALQNGIGVKTVSGMLGHYSAGFTLDTYAHVTTAAQR